MVSIKKRSKTYKNKDEEKKMLQKSLRKLGEQRK